MRCAAFILCALCLSAALGADELTAEQRARLETAHDGGDHREEAFFALVENVRAWAGHGATSPTEPVRLAIDPVAMVANPERFRGELCLVLGRLEQHTPLAPPYDVGEEWFIRDRSGEPVIVYVVDAEAGAVREGRRVRVLARFYKRIDAVDREGRERSYAAFVGSQPQVVRVADGRESQALLIVLVPVVVLLGGFLALMAYVRRQRRDGGTTRRAVGEADITGDDPRPLPDDPAEALAELKRRADAAEE